MTVQAVHRSIGWAVAALLAGVCGLPAAVGNVHLQQQDSGVRVLIDGEHFTTYLLTGHAKPILFLIHAASGTCVTRSWPMHADHAEDPHDHPHHESLWFANGNVNGIDFWTHKAVTPGGPQPSITHESVRTCTSGATGVLETTNRWCAADGSVVCTDFHRLESFGTQAARTIDFALTIRADHGAVTRGDAKEGTMGMRFHPALQLPDATRPQAATGASSIRRGCAMWMFGTSLPAGSIFPESSTTIRWASPCSTIQAICDTPPAGMHVAMVCAQPIHLACTILAAFPRELAIKPSRPEAA